ncbi:MAG: tail tape measure protein [Sphingopyxis sp.]|nr:tail tape measure protein [Sphingopyxis sp.]
MADQVDELVVQLRADGSDLRREVAALKGELEGPLSAGAARAGNAIESALSRAVQTGKLGFDDLRRVAVTALAEIARSAIASGIGAIGGGGSGGIGGLLTSVLTGLAGAPGRATGGPVSAGRAYLVGERGPELFVPTASGRVEASGSGGVRGPVTINVNVRGGTENPERLARSGRQVARAVRRAISELED